MSLIDKIRTKARSDVKTIVLPEGDEERTIKAAAILKEEGLAEPVLIGNREKIEEKAKELGVTPMATWVSGALGGVDPAARAKILDLILENHTKDSTILLSTHLISDVEYIFDRVLMINQGHLIVNEEVAHIRAKGNTVENVFKEVFRNAW